VSAYLSGGSVQEILTRCMKDKNLIVKIKAHRRETKKKHGEIQGSTKIGAFSNFT
jgi:hypothetical protein